MGVSSTTPGIKEVQGVNGSGLELRKACFTSINEASDTPVLLQPTWFIFEMDYLSEMHYANSAGSLQLPQDLPAHWLQENAYTLLPCYPIQSPIPWQNEWSYLILPIPNSFVLFHLSRTQMGSLVLPHLVLLLEASQDPAPCTDSHLWIPISMQFIVCFFIRNQDLKEWVSC